MDTVALTGTQKAVLQQRYIPLLKHLRHRANRIALMFHTSRTIITVGSLIVPALLSVQYTSTPPSGTMDVATTVYWTTWVISLFVTMCNGLLTLFKLDKKYFSLHTTLEHLTSEGWQFIELTARYSGFHTPGQRPTHENQFIFFCHAVEKIRMRQIEEEYFKLAESHTTSTHAPPNTGGTTSSSATENQIVSSLSPSSLIPPTPLKEELTRLPPDIQKALKEQLSLAKLDGVSAAPRGEGAQASSPDKKTAAAAASAATAAAPAPPNAENKENGQSESVSVLPPV